MEVTYTRAKAPNSFSRRMKLLCNTLVVKDYFNVFMSGDLTGLCLYITKNFYQWLTNNFKNDNAEGASSYRETIS